MSSVTPIEPAATGTTALDHVRRRLEQGARWTRDHAGSLGWTVSLVVFYIVTRALLLWRFPGYFDESFYAHEAPIALHDPTQRFISLMDSKGPLFLWLSFIPLKLGAQPLTAVRLIAQASGLWTMAMIGLTTRRLFDARTGLVAMTIVAVVPLWLVFTAIGFDEPLVAAAAMTALYLQIRLIELPTFRDASLLGVALGAGLLTKQSGEFALLFLPFSVLLFAHRAPRLLARFASWLGAAVLAAAIAYAFYAVERLSPLWYQRGEIARSLGQYTPLHTSLSHAGSIFQQNWPGYRAEVVDYLTVPIVLGVAVGFGVLLARRRLLGLLLLLWVLVQLGGVVLIATRPLGHYLIPALSPALVPAAVGVTETVRALRRRLAPRTAWAAVAVVTLILLVPALVFDARFLADPARGALPSYDDLELITGPAAGSGWKEFASIIKRRTAGSKAPHVIAYGGLITYDLSLALNDPSATRYPYVTIDSPQAASAQFVVSTGTLPSRCSAKLLATSYITIPVCSVLPRHRLVLLRSYERPRGGVRLTLYAVQGNTPVPTR